MSRQKSEVVFYPMVNDIKTLADLPRDIRLGLTKETDGLVEGWCTLTDSRQLWRLKGGVATFVGYIKKKW